MKTILLLGLVFLVKLSNAQSQDSIFHRIDSATFGLGELKGLDIASATIAITSSYKDPLHKVRAIYAWIANNIQYDCEAYHSEAKRKSKAEEVFQFRKAICEGYANLFQEMCSYSNIQCIIIDGNARNGIEPCEKHENQINHAWNAVKINNEWHLVDPTWASGYTDEKVKIFTRAFSEIYFFPKPESFVFNHYPKVKFWTLSSNPITQSDFLEIPTARPGILNFKVTSFSPDKGTIKQKEGSVVKFSLHCDNPSEIYNVRLRTGDSRNSYVTDVPFEIDKNIVTFVSDKLLEGEYPLKVFINGIELLIYCMEVE